MAFKEGDKVKVTAKDSPYEGRIGEVLYIYGGTIGCSGFDNDPAVILFGESDLELMDPEREALIELAETLDKARRQAKPDGEHVARANLTREIEVVLYRTLMLLTDELLDVNTVFDAVLAGTGVREALALVEEDEDDRS